MSRILIAHASQMGSTAEIAEAIAGELRQAGFDVDVADCDHAHDAVHYDAVIIGSAVYVGRWRRSATDYLKHQAPDLAERPTWLFQSGPCGEGAQHETIKTPHHVRKLAFQIGLALPVTFGGRLDHARANTPFTHWMSTGALSGDYRDWDAIHAWARSIARDLRPDSDDHIDSSWVRAVPDLRHHASA